MNRTESFNLSISIVCGIHYYYYTNTGINANSLISDITVTSILAVHGLHKTHFVATTQFNSIMQRYKQNALCNKEDKCKFLELFAHYKVWNNSLQINVIDDINASRLLHASRKEDHTTMCEQKAKIGTYLIQYIHVNTHTHTRTDQTDRMVYR